MRPVQSPLALRILTFLAGVLIVKVTLVVVTNYRDYLPPNFASDFLRGREGHFWGPYRWAFWTHILAGPVTLILGLMLVSTSFRTRWPRWHRWLGRIQVGCVLVLVAPSGLWMAWYAAAGSLAGLGLASLAISTAICAIMGARFAMILRFADHRRWMWRCYLLLCSAVVLRMMGGLATVFGVTAGWFDPLAVWMSWIVPIAAFEVRERLR